MNAIFQLPKPINEPILSYAPGTPQRAALKQAIAEAKAMVRDIPMVIGGQEVRTGNTKQVNPPHEHAHVLANFHQGDAGHVEQAITAALNAKKDWENLSWDQRAAISTHRLLNRFTRVKPSLLPEFGIEWSTARLRDLFSHLLHSISQPLPATCLQVLH
jgi:hypothetical protein